jgi:hypothetical protein
MQLPFTGQGGNPPEGPVDLHVSALLERLLSVDDKEYRFEAIIYIYFSWEDPRAFEAMANATNAFRDGTLEECKRPCSYEGINLSRESKGFGSDVSCCDSMWLPTVGMFNVYDLPEGRLQPYSIGVTENSTGVSWWTGIHATWFTPMQFSRFPFDAQELVMQFSFTPTNVISNYIPSASSTRFLIRGEGDIVSGWDVTDLVVEAKNFTLQSELEFFIGNYGKYPVASDPNPVIPPIGESIPSEARIVAFDIRIKIQRLWSYYVLNMIVPILLLVSLSLITYIIPAESLDARVALNVTLFLSLTALQFIINDQLPRSSYPSAVTKLILVCYVVVAFGVPETIVVYAIARSSSVKEEMEKQQQSARKLSTLSNISEEEEWLGEEDKKASNHRNNSSLARLTAAAQDGEAATPVPSSMSIALKVFKRSKSGKVAFLIDMTSLVVVLVTIIVSTILTLSGY